MQRNIPPETNRGGLDETAKCRNKRECFGDWDSGSGELGELLLASGKKRVDDFNGHSLWAKAVRRSRGGDKNVLVSVEIKENNGHGRTCWYKTVEAKYTRASGTFIVVPRMIESRVFRGLSMTKRPFRSSPEVVD